MPFISGGVFQRLFNWVTDASNGIPMTASRFDADANDMASGLSNCVTRNGQSPLTANLPMGGYKLTGLTQGSTNGDSVSYDQLTGLATPTTGVGIFGFNPTLNYALGTLGGHLAGDAYNPRDYPWLAKFDGTTDDATAINACATAARSGPRAMKLPGGVTASVGSSLNFSGLHVRAEGSYNQLPHIKATSAQFNVITSTGTTVLDGLYVHGGWDGSTTGLSGYIVSFDNGSGGFAYNCHIRNCIFQYGKLGFINWQNGGYGTIWATKCNAAGGAQGLNLFGNSAAFACTTVMVGGMSIFSDCPSGYGATLTECVMTPFVGVIMENTKGIKTAGNDNRALSFSSVYQENTTGSVFLDTSASSGIGLSFDSCFGGGATVPYPTNWLEVYYRGNSSGLESAVPLANRVITNDGGQLTTTTTGGVSVTATSVVLTPGTWQIYGAVQTLNGSGASFVRAGATVTTNAADTGLDNSTSTFVFGADEVNYVPSSGAADVRLQPFDIIQNTTTGSITVYLRAYFNISGGTLAYRGQLKAVKLS